MSVYVRNVPRAYPSTAVRYPLSRLELQRARIRHALTVALLACWSVAGIAIAVFAVVSCLPV